ncbi:MAG: ATP-dependent helicase HrpB [Bacteroidetes bacterium]|nr:ATP-dependent helicase HrpB [Bacteroidota bacterium]
MITLPKLIEGLLPDSFPVEEIIPAVKASLEKQNTLIVAAPPGAGKSTILPLQLLHEPWLAEQKILMLEPRRLAARAIATRMASLKHEVPGNTIGYRVRFETVVGPDTRIEVITEGILTRMLQSDNALEGVGLVIFDEFHERSLNADLALALCREAQQVLRPDLRILIMSATLNLPGLSAMLKAPVIESKGKMFPVEIRYTGSATPDAIPELTAVVIEKAVKEETGDILTFLPGEAEIKKCEEILLGKRLNCKILPLFGQLQFNLQQSAILPDKHGRRKIVLATSIAETSLTIEGIRIVVDSGYSRVSVYDPASGLSKLQTVRVSIDSADQRTGRAGRIEPGVCYRLWSQADQLRMDRFRAPEILQADLTPLLLELSAWGIQDPQSLTWIDPPPPGVLAASSELLTSLGALRNGKITDHGKEMLKLPCHPRIAHMLLKADSLLLKHLATDIAAILEERDPLGREAGIDINLRIEALRRQRSLNKAGGRFSRISKIAAGYRKIIAVEEDNSSIDSFNTGLLLAYAFPERIASAKPGTNARFQLANGKYVMASHTDDLAHESWLAVANADMRDGNGKIFLASPIDPADLRHLVEEHETITWDTRRGGLIAASEIKIGSLVLKSTSLKNIEPEKVVTAVTDAIKKEGETMLSWDEKFILIQNRILSLRKWNPQQDWPGVTRFELLANPAGWLGDYLLQIKKPDDLKKIPLSEVLVSSLTWEEQTLLNKLAPEYFTAPTGSRIRIQYFPNGEPPVLPVRLQEMFGQAQTPTVNDGKTPVLLHLLSPGYKPVQVTSDLISFWNNTYFEVRKELKRRYPKHSWPDDPWKAPPVAKGRPTKS